MNVSTSNGRKGGQLGDVATKLLGFAPSASEDACIIVQILPIVLLAQVLLDRVPPVQRPERVLAKTCEVLLMSPVL